MKRSNRLIMLLGFFLAAVAFVLVFVVSSSPAPAGGTAGGAPPVPMAKIVTAKVNIPAGTTVSPEQVEEKEVPQTQAPATSFTSSEQVRGQVVRRAILAGETFTSRNFEESGNPTGNEVVRNLKAGLRAMAVQVDQVSGVGTLIQTGDRVDVVLAMETTDAKLPVLAESPKNVTLKPDFGAQSLNSTSIKVLVQNVEVLGTLLPPPEAQEGQQTPAQGDQDQNQPENQPENQNQGTALTGQQQIAILALSPQQVELVRFAQLDGNLSLVLRSPADAGKPADATTGITLRQLVDRHGVLPPRVVVTQFP